MNRATIRALILIGFAAMLALNLPGQMSYDSVSQLFQGRNGYYNSWHPPVMAFLLGGFDRLWPGPALFVVFDAALLGGAWLMLLSLGKRPGKPAFAVALFMLLTPQFLLYQGTVWKDVLFADAAVAAFAALAMAVERRGRAAMPWLLLSGALLVLATLTRQNGLVLLPVAATTLAWTRAGQAGCRRGMVYGAAFLGITLIADLGLSAALLAHGDGGAAARDEIRLAQAYDLTGAVRNDPALALPLLQKTAPRLTAEMRGEGARLYISRAADPLLESGRFMAALATAPEAAVFREWVDFLMRHPADYLSQRAAVFWWVLATPDVALCHPAFVGIEGDPGELKALGLAARIRKQDAFLASYTRGLMGTPVLSHLAFALLAAVLLVALLRRRRPADLAVAGLQAAALVFTASFFVVSIACDYRYLLLLDLAAMSGGFYWAATWRRER